MFEKKRDYIKIFATVRRPEKIFGKYIKKR